MYNTKNRKLIEREKERQRIGTECEGKLIRNPFLGNIEIILF